VRAHLYRVLRVTVTTVIAALPAIAANDAVLDFVADHPALAAYFPLATGVVYAVYRAYRNRERTSS
jgi:hypothetical protein